MQIRMTRFYCGMALGFDMMAAEVVLSLKDKFPDIQLIAVVPFSGQSNRWTSSEQERYHRILAKTDKVVTLSENYSVDVYSDGMIICFHILAV